MRQRSGTRKLATTLLLAVLAVLGCGGGDSDGDGDSDRTPDKAGHDCPFFDRGTWLEYQIYIEHDEPKDCPVELEYHGQGYTVSLTLVTSELNVTGSVTYWLTNSLGIDSYTTQSNWNSEWAVAKAQVFQQYSMGSGNFGYTSHDTLTMVVNSHPVNPRAQGVGALLIEETFMCPGGPCAR